MVGDYEVVRPEEGNPLRPEVITDELHIILAELAALDDGLLGIGYDQDMITSLFDDDSEHIPEEPPAFKDPVDTVRCPECGHEFAI